MAANDGLLVLDAVTAGYGDADVVEGVSLDVQRGEVAAVVSLDLSGGKSTLLRAAVGLLEPRRGRVLFDGQDVYRMSYSDDQRYRKRCSVVLEGGALLVNRSIWDNVALPLRYHEWVRARELRVRVERLLAQCGYTEDLHAFPWQVSARSRRLAAFARALARDPDLVVVDRFFEGLEMPDWRRLFELVLELNQQQGTSWLLVSELDPAIFQVAERVAVLDAGKLLDYGFRRRLFRDARIKAAFDAGDAKASGEHHPDSERILIVDSDSELAAISSAGSDLSVASPASGALVEDVDLTIDIDGRMPGLAELRAEALAERRAARAGGKNDPLAVTVHVSEERLVSDVPTPAPPAEGQETVDVEMTVDIDPRELGRTSSSSSSASSLAVAPDAPTPPPDTLDPVAPDAPTPPPEVDEHDDSERTIDLDPRTVARLRAGAREVDPADAEEEP